MTNGSGGKEVCSHDGTRAENEKPGAEYLPVRVITVYEPREHAFCARCGGPLASAETCDKCAD
jgi:hypothetical protein